MKKILCLLLALAMLLSLAACGAAEKAEPMDPWLQELMDRAEAGELYYGKAAYWYTQALEQGNLVQQEEAEANLSSMRNAGLIPQTS